MGGEHSKALRGGVGELALVVRRAGSVSQRHAASKYLKVRLA